MSAILKFPKQPPKRREGRFAIALQRNYYQHDEVCANLSIDQAFAIQKALADVPNMRVIIKFERMVEAQP